MRFFLGVVDIVSSSGEGVKSIDVAVKGIRKNENGGVPTMRLRYCNVALVSRLLEVCDGLMSGLKRTS